MRKPKEVLSQRSGLCLLTLNYLTQSWHLPSRKKKDCYIDVWTFTSWSRCSSTVWTPSYCIFILLFPPIMMLIRVQNSLNHWGINMVQDIQRVQPLSFSSNIPFWLSHLFCEILPQTPEFPWVQSFLWFQKRPGWLDQVWSTWREKEKKKKEEVLLPSRMLHYAPRKELNIHDLNVESSPCLAERTS